jgi:hypothetical protein
LGDFFQQKCDQAVKFRPIWSHWVGLNIRIFINEPHTLQYLKRSQSKDARVNGTRQGSSDRCGKHLLAGLTRQLPVRSKSLDELKFSSPQKEAHHAFQNRRHSFCVLILFSWFTMSSATGVSFWCKW